MVQVGRPVGGRFAKDKLRAKLHPDDRRVVVRGEEALGLVGRHDLLGGAGRLEPVDEALHLAAEGLVVRRQVLVADDDELGRLVADREGLLLEVLGPDGLGVVRDGALARQVPRQEGAHEPEGDDDRGDPGADRPPGVRRGSAREPFGHEAVLTDVPGVPSAVGW